MECKKCGFKYINYPSNQCPRCGAKVKWTRGIDLILCLVGRILLSSVVAFITTAVLCILFPR